MRNLSMNVSRSPEKINAGDSIKSYLDKIKYEDKKKQRDFEFERPNHVISINVTKPAYLEIVRDRDSIKNLVITSFVPLQNYNAIKVIKNIDDIFDRIIPPDIKVKVINRDIKWPNNITPVNDRRLFDGEGFLIAGGFIVWPNNTGEVSFIDINTEKKEKITKDKEGWFYHTARPYFRKGRPGVLTARSNKSMFHSEGEFVWLEKPKNKGDEWKEHIIGKGPDVHFDVRDVNRDGKDEFVAGEFFNDKISFFWEKDGRLKKRIINQDLGKPFDVDFVDLDGDGQNQILATNHEKNGSVFVYDIPKDFEYGNFQRSTILNNIKTRNFMPNEFAPGKALAFYPNKRMKGKKHIIVSGDGAGTVHLMAPKDPLNKTNKKNREFIVNTLIKEDSTIGKIKIDYDDEGFASIYIPVYDKDKVKVFSYNPKFHKEGARHEKNTNSIHRRHDWNEKR